MSLEDFIKTNTENSGKVTREMLDKSMRDVLYRGLTPLQALALDERLYGSSYVHATTGERIPPWEVGSSSYDVDTSGRHAFGDFDRTSPRENGKVLQKGFLMEAAGIEPARRSSPESVAEQEECCEASGLYGPGSHCSCKESA